MERSPPGPCSPVASWERGWRPATAPSIVGRVVARPGLAASGGERFAKMAEFEEPAGPGGGGEQFLDVPA